MPATEPQHCDYLLAQAFNDQDLDAAVALYEQGASVRRLADGGGDVAHGDAGIREVMAGYVGLRPHMDLTVHHVTCCDDIAMLRSQWRIIGTDTKGVAIELAHHGIEVVRRQSDGTWKFLIDHPYGADPDWGSPFTALPALSQREQGSPSTDPTATGHPSR